MNAINRERSEELKVRIEPLRQQVEEWRKHKAVNERMPERLWEAATELAKGYGVSPVQGILRIDYRGLQRRAFGREKPAAQARPTERPRFIELPSLASRRAEHVVELEDAAGRKLSLKIPAGHLAEVLPLAQAFWRPSV
jgi:hypothetical protein